MLVAEKKFFAQQHININVTLIATGASGEFAALRSGSVDFVQAAQDAVISANASGANLTSVMGWSNVDLFSLLGAPGVTSAQDVKGKSCAATNTSTGDAFLMKAILAKSDLTYPNDYSIIVSGGVGSRVESVLLGQAKCGIFLEPQTSEVLAGGGSILGTAATALGSNYQYLTGITTPAWASSHKGVLIRFLTAMVEADQWLHNPANENEAAEILAASPSNISDYQAKSAWVGLYGKPNTFTTNLTAADVKAAIQTHISEGNTGVEPSQWQKYANLSYLQAATAAAK
jgi:ABC-type nitrate/sulfonate/bicarbonate transport system substrate-binding protein